MYIDTVFFKAKMLLARTTKAELAKKCGCSEYVIRAMCSNNYQPTTALARKIAFHLRLTNEDIIQVFFSELKKLSLDEVKKLEKAKRKLTK